jgi:hypothetical protein
MKKKTRNQESWKPLYYASRTLENWIIPHNEKDIFRTQGVLVKIMRDYFNSQLKGTAVNVRNEINNVIYFHGEVPESFLGRIVDIQQKVIGEDKDSYTVEQIILPLDPMIEYKEKIFHSSTFPKEFGCNRMEYAIGKFPKK